MDHKKIEKTLEKLKSTVCSEAFPIIKELVTSMGYKAPPKPPDLRVVSALKILREAKANEVYYSKDGEYVCFFKHQTVLYIAGIDDLDELHRVICSPEKVSFSFPVSYVIQSIQGITDERELTNKLEEFFLSFELHYLFNFAV